ncbi:o-succinylbenzoic acid (OSB) synthetase (plasmid) [Gemmatirosa kalamazoonensis]|uniref:o-succinylbenzoate synthase n=1 Tax=Gemmatirosa kalamazoonensis TaxID=861299 RepID=W0RV83_9BACT|nr:o-succinylbenzoate synthase [Gemmatirosa kalamazoonensis]AHG93498.1 o-succinylbenzoic acid (OSB) synthetase [Gemmatirosa kalamazoonensis]
MPNVPEIRVARLTLREIHLPLREPFRISSGVMADRRILLLELEEADGARTWSECVADALPNYSPETIDTCWLAITEWIAPRVLGAAFAHPRDIWPVLDRDIRGHQMAKAALEMGCWALAAEKEGVPLARLLGGTRDWIETGISLGIQASPEALVQRAAAAVAEGYRKVKLKIEPGRDVAYVRAVREALPDAPLMADANNAYTLAQADVLQQLDAFGLMMIEQPLAHDDLLRHAALQKQLATPVCLDETITSVDRAEDMLALDAGRIINIKPGRVGGFTQSIAIHDVCARSGVPVWCGGMLESGVGRAYNVALASLPNFTKPGDLSPSARYWARDVVDPEWTMDADGRVRVPLDRPGIGVTVNMDRVDALTVRTLTLGV